MELDNPFFHRGPIRDPRFFWNRTEEVTQAHSLLARGQSVSVVGPRRIGKSSLLLHLGINDTANDTANGDTHWIYFDCQGWSTATPETLYALLLEAMAGSNVDALDVIPPAAAQIGYRTFRNAVMQAAARGRLIFLLDEFEALSANPLLDAGFFSSLRALATSGHVAFVTATTESLGRLTFAEPSALSSPFFNIFAQINLFPFAQQTAMAMLRHYADGAGAPFPTAAVDFVLELAGPHPFFAQIAAYFVFEQMARGSSDLTPQAQERIKSHFLAEVEPHWHYLWNEIQPAQQKQMALAYELSALSPALLRRLRQLGIILDTPQGDILLSPALAAFLARQPVDGILRAPPVTIDTAQRRVFVTGQPVDVSSLEYELLRLLAAHAGDVLSPAQIQAQLWPSEAEGIDNQDRLKGVLKTLRRKLAGRADLIRNERNRGYTLGNSQHSRTRSEWNAD